MKNTIHRKVLVIWLIMFALVLSSCSLLIGKFNEQAYQNAISLKVDSLALMDKAITPYSDNESAIDSLNVKLDKAYEYAKGLPKNELVTKQWAIMKDPSRNLIGGFLQLWKDTNGSLSKAFITEAKKNVSLGFDQIIGLESGKLKPSDIK